MDRPLRLLVALFVLLAGVLPARHAQGAAALERGVAITDPLALRELDRAGLGLGNVLSPTRSPGAPLTGNQVFGLPSMAAVRNALDDEFDRYVARHKASLPNESIGVGDSFDF